MPLCKKPFCRSGSLSFGCGQCMPCRISRRRLWTHRILLESLCHSSSAFITLTYDDEHVPPGGTLVIKDYQKFLYSLRQLLSPRKLRYVFVGEYGESTWRPHYHAIIFGLCPSEEEVVRLAWKRGHIMVGDVTPASAQYVCGYVTKKMTNKNDPRLEGRYPEFMRPSLKPGIGALAVPKLVDVLTSEKGHLLLDSEGDVPQVISHGRRQLPLGRYLRMKMRQRYGFEETGTPKEVLRALSEEMYRVFEADFDAAKENGISVKQFYRQKAETRKQQILNIETKFKAFTKKGWL